MNTSKFVALSLLPLVLVCLGCQHGLRSGAGLRLPTGDIERGIIAFQDLGCGNCHDVVGGPPSPEGARAAVIVTLGGHVTRIQTHGELITSIVNPSHDLTKRFAKEDVADGDVSKMRNFNQIMTVAQLIDLTAFLQSRYEVPVEPEWTP